MDTSTLNPDTVTAALADCAPRAAHAWSTWASTNAVPADPDEALVAFTEHVILTDLAQSYNPRVRGSIIRLVACAIDAVR